MARKPRPSQLNAVLGRPMSLRASTTVIGHFMAVVLTSVLCLMVASESLARDEEHAPLPDKLLKARSAYLINDSGDVKAYDRFYRDLTKWSRFTVVSSRDNADIVMVLTSSSQSGVTAVSGSSASTGGVTTGSATATTVPSTSLHLRVLDAKTDEILWTDMTEKWIASGHAPAKLVSNLKKRFPRAPHE